MIAVLLQEESSGCMCKTIQQKDTKHVNQGSSSGKRGQGATGDTTEAESPGPSFGDCRVHGLRLALWALPRDR